MPLALQLSLDEENDADLLLYSPGCLVIEAPACGKPGTASRTYDPVVALVVRRHNDSAGGTVAHENMDLARRMRAYWMKRRVTGSLRFHGARR